MHKSLTEIIKHRRAIYPAAYTDQPITEAEIAQVLEAARWAPTHKRTEPWRFVVLHSTESRALLGQHMADHYMQHLGAEEYNEIKHKKPSKNTAAAGCVIAIVLHRDPQERLPEWEEMCAAACAVQNMWLTCTDLGIGAYWSTHGSIESAGNLLQLADNQRCIGYFFMGHALPEAWLDGKRQPIDVISKTL